MSYARLQLELLAARDSRDVIIGQVMTGQDSPIVVVATAIPGPGKTSGSVKALFRWSLRQLEARLANCRSLFVGADALGPWAIFRVVAEPRDVKRSCVAIEMLHPAARLLDLDVYPSQGHRVGREEVGEAQRSCLLCERPAFECIRLKRHDFHAVVDRANGLIQRFGA